MDFEYRHGCIFKLEKIELKKLKQLAHSQHQLQRAKKVQVAYDLFVFLEDMTHCFVLVLEVRHFFLRAAAIMTSKYFVKLELKCTNFFKVYYEIW